MTTKNEIINPLDIHINAMLGAIGTSLREYGPSGPTADALRALLGVAVADLAPASAAPAGELSDEQIKTILLTAGYTIKPGLDDLKPYVYSGARALLAVAKAFFEKNYNTTPM